MKRICRYQCTDGQEFEDLEEAKSHEIFLETQMELTTELLSAIRTGRVESVIDLMIAHAPKVRDILNRHLRRQPKVKTDES